MPLKRTADEAMAAAPGVKRCLVLRRTGNDVPMEEGRDVWLHDVDTGQRRLWEEIPVEDSLSVLQIRVTPDGGTWAVYGEQGSSELYLVEGLH